MAGPSAGRRAKALTTVGAAPSGRSTRGGYKRGAMDLLALSRALIAADTVSSKGTEAALRVLKPLYEAAGLEIQVQENVVDGVRQQNLYGRYDGADLRGLLLVTHLDTVDPGPSELWTETGGRPYELTVKGDKLYGLGSADTKLDALCKLAAAQSFRGRKLRRSLELLGTYQEEVGGKGARFFVRSPLFRARFVACSEPSELRIIRAHKGYAVVVVDASMPSPAVDDAAEEVVFDGRAAHSSTPHLGVNAIEKAAAAVRGRPVVRFDGGTVANKVPARCAVRFGKGQDVSGLVALGAELFAAWKEAAQAQQPRRNDAFDPAECVVNWGVANVEAGRGRFVFDCRLLPGHVPEALMRSFEARAKALSAQRGAKVEVQVDRSSPAMELKEPSELLEAAKAASGEVGLNPEPQAKPTNTEAGIFASAGAEAIVFGPGRSTGNAHCANEHNLYSQLEKAIEFYRALIARLCL